MCHVAVCKFTFDLFLLFSLFNFQINETIHLNGELSLFYLLHTKITIEMAVQINEGSD